MPILPARQILNDFFHWERCYWQCVARSWGPTEALIQGFIPTYEISRLFSLWSSDKVLFIVFIFWPLGFATIYYMKLIFIRPVEYKIANIHTDLTLSYISAYKNLLSL